MVRTTQTRIASRSVLGKRRRLQSGARFKRRRLNTRRRRAVTQTTQSAVGRFLPFRSRRVPGRTWRSMIWRDSLQMSHYRSNAARSSSITSAATVTQKTISMIDALDNGAGFFWNSSGGAQVLDTAGGIPTWNGDIILRGGKTSCSFYNESTANPVEIEAFYIIPSPRMTTGVVPTLVTVGWDPSIIPEFRQNVGKIIYRTKFLLEPNATSTIDRRLRVQKIDQKAWSDGMRPRWIITVRDFASSAVLTTNVITVVSFNLSFAGDAS